MISNLKPLVEKLNTVTRGAMEGAAGLCVSRTHYEIEIEHFLLKAIEVENGDTTRIAAYYGMDEERLKSDLRKCLDRFKTGNARGPVFSPALVEMFSEAWVIATLNFEASTMRTGHALLALLSEGKLARMLLEASGELNILSFSALLNDFRKATDGSIEAMLPEGVDAGVKGSVSPNGGSPTATPFLDQYTIDMTREAREGRSENIVGRDSEIRQMIDILLRRRQNNPILTGEAGVGKTAVVEGLSQRIADGDVPPALANVRLHSLDLPLLQAGASVKGEFENRLKGLIQEVKASTQPVILFIDEAHTMVGAGAPAGQADLANILKPALARGEFRTIAATTWAEYKRYFEKDTALARRFQVIKVEEPSEQLCEAMLHAILPSLEKHHGTRILDEAVKTAVHLSHRYLPGRQLPDKAIGVLDTACARVALSRSAFPVAMESLTRLISIAEAQKRLLLREQATGAQHSERIEEFDEEIRSATDQLTNLNRRWDQELNLSQQMERLHTTLEGDVENADARTKTLEELMAVQGELRCLQGQSPLTHLVVDAQIVAAVLAEWTGIPLGKMLDGEIVKLLRLPSDLKQRIVGQDHALSVIAQRIWTSRAQLDDPGKPIGVFLLAGPSGVGKTETALALSDLLYGGEQNMISINMSEFQEAHNASALKGAPPGYVGYGEGGILTEAVRRQPYSVVLLDEIEKAHPDVLELFFQVFDKGYIEDGEGRYIDFRNTLILLTTNAGSDMIAKLATDPENVPSPVEIATAVRPLLNRLFKPAFLGRTLLVPYYPLSDEILKKIVRLKLGTIERRLKHNHHISFGFDEDVVDLIQERCTEVESGARNIDHLLGNTLLPELSRNILAFIAQNETPQSVSVRVSPDNEFTYDWRAKGQPEVSLTAYIA